MNLETLPIRTDGARLLGLTLLATLALPLATLSLAQGDDAAASAATSSASTAAADSAASPKATAAEPGMPSKIVSAGPIHKATEAVPGVFGFSHKAHLERGSSCTDCHDATQERAQRMPKMENCTSCHDADKSKPVEKECYTCHTVSGGKPVAPKWTVPPELKGVRFNHQKHTVDAKLDCKVCHKGIEDSERLTPEILPKMQLCIDCHHQRGAAAVSCAKCHTGDLKRIRPASHSQGNWTKLHGQEVRRGHARPMKQECSFCHQQSFCVSCHQDQAPANHTNEFRLRGHGLMAGIDRDKCLACHRQDACVRCHQTTPPSTGPNAHRTGFGFPSNRHCSSCHLTRNTCSVCHKAQTSHQAAPPAPGTVPQHAASFPAPVNCRDCHRPGRGLSHPDPGFDCTACHRRP